MKVPAINQAANEAAEVMAQTIQRKKELEDVIASAMKCQRFARECASKKQKAQNRVFVRTGNGESYFDISNEVLAAAVKATVQQAGKEITKVNDRLIDAHKVISSKKESE